jgi:hypothetical protein
MKPSPFCQQIVHKIIGKIIRIGMGALFLAAIPRAEGAPAKNLYYAATFSWDTDTSASRGTLKIVLSKAQKPGYRTPQIIAKIIRVAAPVASPTRSKTSSAFRAIAVTATEMNEKLEAICSVQQVESYAMAQGKPPQAASVELSCKSAALGALTAPATLYFQDASGVATSRKKPVLRFGTWLQGYQQAVLTTKFDRSARLIEEFVRPGAEHVKLARAR